MVIVALLLTLGLATALDASAQTQTEWPVQVIETKEIPPVRITDPRLRMTDNTIHGHPHLELTFLAQNITAEPVAADVWVWAVEFRPDDRLYGAFRMIPEPPVIEPGHTRRVRFIYLRDQFDPPPDGTRVIIALKSAFVGDHEWTQHESVVWARAHAVAAGAQRASLDDVSYDEFMKHPPLDRKRIFNSLAQAKKADLMLAHLERYLISHGAELTVDQRTLVDEALGGITANTYMLPKQASESARMHEFDARARLLFTPGEVVQVFTLDGERIPQ